MSSVKNGVSYWTKNGEGRLRDNSCVIKLETCSTNSDLYDVNLDGSIKYAMTTEVYVQAKFKLIVEMSPG
ncbi:unnamed protein product [Urochloa humidicola]